MRYWIGITDWDWFGFLRDRQPLDEVNFWQPSGTRRPVELEPGAPFLFKLHASHGGAIVGGGFFAHYTALPAILAWETFGEENGAASREEMLARIGRYRHRKIDAYADQVGCLVLVQPFFLAERDWIPRPQAGRRTSSRGRGTTLRSVSVERSGCGYRLCWGGRTTDRARDRRGTDMASRSS